MPETSTQSITRLVTHDGFFHADEVLSTAILRGIYPRAEIIRTRDPEILARESANPKSIVYDVGRAYDPRRLVFDHHQPGAPTRFDDTPYSALGLIWRHFGRAYLARRGVDDDLIGETWVSFDEAIVQPIDQLDNGAMPKERHAHLGNTSLSLLVEGFNPTFDSTGDETRAFLEATRISGAMLHAQADTLAAESKSMNIVHDAVMENPTAPIIELPRGVPFSAAIQEPGARHVLYVIQEQKSDWGITAVNTELNSFQNRQDLPAAWAGLEHKDLEAASGIKGAVFCHRALFFAVTKTREGAYDLANRSLELAGIQQDRGDVRQSPGKTGPSRRGRELTE